MGKETFNIIKKSLATLMVVMFLSTVTSVAVNATRDNYNETWGQISKNNYNTSYNTSIIGGYVIGAATGKIDGQNDCLFGQESNCEHSRVHLPTTGITKAATLGKIDGYNDGIDNMYCDAYDKAYKESENESMCNSQIMAKSNNE